MYLNPRPNQFSARGMAPLVVALLVGALVAPFSVQAQAPPFPTPLPMCYVPPYPEGDGWPVAVGDDLGSTPQMPVTFPRAALMSNDTGTSLAVTSVDAIGSSGGRITGTDPLTYSPPIPFLGPDSFTYEISDAAGQTAIGIVRVLVTADTVAPLVSITAPVGITVSGTVTVKASASDNVGVTSVTFFDAGTPIGVPAVAAPFQAFWNTTLVGNGNHTLTAIATDAAGNLAASAPVAVDVNNASTVTVPSVVGLTQTAAQSAITGATLAVGAVTTANSATVASGLVISQSPTAGSTVAPNSAVTFIVSVGPALVTVPSVAGLTQSAAQTAITGASLTVGAVTTANSATVASGLVISQSPTAGSSVAPSSMVSFVVSIGPAPVAAVPAVDKMVFSEGLGKRTTPAFSTTSAGEMLVAFAASDGPAAANAQTLTVAGAGLTWTRVRRAATQFGDAEIWKASAPTVLTNVTVSSTQSSAGVHQSLTVIAFTGVGGVGASNIAGAVTGAPSASVVTTAAGSVVYSVGSDWDRAVARTIPTGQTKVHEFVDTAVGDTFWVQAAAGTTGPAGSTVTLNATAPTTDQWNLAIVELTPAAAPVSVAVPNVVGLSQAAAQTTITSAGLAVGAVTTANSATVPSGMVISQNPAAGVSAVTGTAVALVVSLGPAPVNVSVPSVVGMTQSAAQTAIAGAGLTVGAISNASSATVPAGQVMSQNPTAGASVATGTAVALVVSSGPAPAGPSVDATAFSDGTGARTTPAFSTTGASVLIALAASDGPPTGTNSQFLTMSGAGLTWTRVARAAASRGVAEIWTATAPAALTNVTVTSTQSVTVVLGAAVYLSLTVVAFTGASGVGASSIASGLSGAPSASLATTADASVVYGVGNDFDQAIARTVPTGQTKVHEFLAPSGDTMWMQRAGAIVAAAGTSVTLNDTAPTSDQWNFAIVEVKR